MSSAEKTLFPASVAGWARSSRDLHEPAERVQGPHQLGSPALDVQQLGTAQDHREAPRPRHGDVQPVPRIQEVEVAGSVLG